MLLQTNSYVVPKDRQAEHKRLMRRFRQTLTRLGCEEFEVYEQSGPNWSGPSTGDRFVQMMRFKDRKQHAALQAAERNDPEAQQLIAEFCELVNFQYQQQQGFFAVGFYSGVLPPPGPSERGETQVEQSSEPATEDSPPASPELAAETQAYAAQEMAEAGEPGHLADSDVSTMEHLEGQSLPESQPESEPEVPPELDDGFTLDMSDALATPAQPQAEDGFEEIQPLEPESVSEQPPEPSPDLPVEVEPAEAPRKSSLFGRRKRG